MNYPPAAGPDPDYSTMRPYNLAARTQPRDSGRQPNRRVAAAIEDRGYVDAAWHLHQDTGDPALLRRTGRDDRIDRIYVSAPLAPALHRYEVLDQPERASDHHGVTVDIDTDHIAPDHLWTYR